MWAQSLEELCGSGTVAPAVSSVMFLSETCNAERYEHIIGRSAGCLFFAVWLKQASMCPSESERDTADLSCVFHGSTVSKTNNRLPKWKESICGFSSMVSFLHFNLMKSKCIGDGIWSMSHFSTFLDGSIRSF